MSIYLQILLLGIQLAFSISLGCLSSDRWRGTIEFQANYLVGATTDYGHPLKYSIVKDSSADLGVNFKIV